MARNIHATADRASTEPCRRRTVRRPVTAKASAVTPSSTMVRVASDSEPQVTATKTIAATTRQPAPRASSTEPALTFRRGSRTGMGGLG
jgi:hypothetical protein